VPDPDVLGPRDDDPGSARGEPSPARAARRHLTGVPAAVQALADDEALPQVRYQWDADTQLLAASVLDRTAGGAAPTSVEVEGDDGSWVTLELRGSRLCGIEVAVWPPVRLRTELAPPTDPTPGHVTVSSGGGSGAATDVEVDTLLAVEADRRRRTFRFRFGRPRPTRAVRVGRDILVDVDEAGVLAGLWLLHVPAPPIPH
jgi:hypothetical protein